ncbi:MAG: prohibitin family protein, partial [Candidatus Latescibacterota bacterium]|nr:prohibitin family protein [Candidatus Latescibacterota bacterium]
ERRLLADARAYEITKINDAIGKNPNYVKLQALEALQAISKDPAAKVYFINGDSPQPLPLMHLGDIK